MAHPREIRDDRSGVTIAHMRDAIAAGVAPVLAELADVKRDLLELRVDVTDLAQRRGRLRRWASENAGTALAHGLAGLAIASVSAAATVLGTHL